MDRKLIVPAISVFVMFCAGCGVERNQKPNVIFILADDLGWSQTGAYGSAYYQTPNIDRLAREGVRFSDAYTAAPVCSPTRASIMTGKHPARLHLTNFIPGNMRDIYPLTQPEMQQFLPIEEITLGNLFSEQGYHTAMFGKWHLSPVKFGPESLPYYPDKQGFTRQFVIDKPCWTTNPELDPHKSDQIGNASVEFIRTNARSPFFLFASFSAIHDPLVERAESISRWKQVEESDKPENNPIIAAILARMDANVGKIIDAVDETGLKDNTIIIFYSDNGGLELNTVYHYDCDTLRLARQTPLREGKGWLYEGGIRVPLIIRWPGVIGEGIVSNEVVSSYDFMPTFRDMLGVDQERDTDGVSILSHLTTREPLSERNHYWHFPHYHRGPPSAAVRSGKWKLIEWYEASIMESDKPAFELYDLENDIAEAVNLADSMKEVTKTLAGDLARWRNEVNAQMPVPNPGYTGGENH